MMRRVRSIRPFWSRRKVRSRAFAGSPRGSTGTGCFASSTPTGSAIILIPPTPARRSRRRCALRLAGPWPSSASATLPRARPEPAAVPSAPFEPSKTACPRSWPWRGSSPSKRPTAGKSGSGVHPVPPGRAPGRQRQHRQMAWVASANPSSPLRAHFVRAVARVHEYPDGQLAIFHGPHRLAEYGPDGSPRDDAKLAA